MRGLLLSLAWYFFPSLKASCLLSETIVSYLLEEDFLLMHEDHFTIQAGAGLLLLKCAPYLSELADFGSTRRRGNLTVS